LFRSLPSALLRVKFLVGSRAVWNIDLELSGTAAFLRALYRKEMRDVVNDRIKHRERFRPFAGAVPLEHVREFFELESHSPYMQFVVPVRESALA